MSNSSLVLYTQQLDIACTIFRCKLEVVIISISISYIFQDNAKSRPYNLS